MVARKLQSATPINPEEENFSGDHIGSSGLEQKVFVTIDVIQIPCEIHITGYKMFVG